MLVCGVVWAPHSEAADPKLPRFASLRAPKVNLRTGPGSRYPVDWILVGRSTPVKIVAVFDTWRKVSDSTGTVGWVHKAMLSSRRTVIVTGARQALYEKAKRSARVVALVEAKVVARLLDCDANWCRLEVVGYRGWVPRNKLWGVGPAKK